MLYLHLLARRASWNKSYQRFILRQIQKKVQTDQFAQTIPDYVLHRLSVSFRLRLQETFQDRG